jgi:opacity protein-like surface antigen
MRGLTLLASLAIGLACALAASVPACAEWYLAAQGGLQVPQDLANIRGTGTFTGATSHDLNLRNQSAYGVKAGYLFEAPNWLGVEFNFSHSDANIERQGTTATAPFLGVAQQQGMTPRVGLTVNHMVMNVLVRYPGVQLEPYLGVGAGLGHSLLRTAPQAESAFYPVVNVLAGMKWFVSDHLALFSEYTHARASVEFADQQFKADLRTHWFMGGIAYHF